MIKLTRIVDCGILVMTDLARRDACVSASELAAGSRLSGPLVAKVLKRLARAGLVKSERGSRGGYRLGRPAAAISLGAIVSALDGPISLTLCTTPPGESSCRTETLCSAREPLQKLNLMVRSAFETISLEDLSRSVLPAPPPLRSTLPSFTENRL